MIDPGRAWELIAGQSAPLAAVDLSLSEAMGHVLAKSVYADRDLPPADIATRDGFAVRSADIGTLPVVLRVRGEVAAGSDVSLSVGPGECARVLTGAVIPGGADAVVMVEDSEPEEEGAGGVEQLRILKQVEKGANISRRGEVAGQGDELLPAGARLGAMGIATCAAAGESSVVTYRRPTVAIVATGAELREVDFEVKPHEIHNSNGPMLVAALRLRRYAVASSSYVTDEAGLIAEYLRLALERSEVVVITGGASVGKYDLTAAAIGSVGATTHFRGVAMTPGRPTLFATTSQGEYIFGLPGNPLSAMTGFHELVLPLLRRLSGRPVEECRPSLRVRLAEDVAGRKGRQRLVLGRLLSGKDETMAEIVKSSGAADLVAGSKADGTIIVPPDTGQLAAGSFCNFRTWK